MGKIKKMFTPMEFERGCRPEPAFLPKSVERQSREVSEGLTWEEPSLGRHDARARIQDFPGGEALGRLFTEDDER